MHMSDLSVGRQHGCLALSKAGSEEGVCTQASMRNLSMAPNVTQVIICCSGLILLWCSFSSEAVVSWCVSGSRQPWPGSPRSLSRVQHATHSGAYGGGSDGHRPLRHLLAAAASASNGSGAGCGAAFPLVEATISGVHTAFTNGTLNCSQLVAVGVGLSPPCYLCWRC